VSGHARILDAGALAFFHHGIAVADAAYLDFDAHLVAGGLRDGSFYEFETTSGIGYLDCFHFAMI
jgi:hypothetical protein